ncbi:MULTISPECIES: DUF3180 domain-containing protein [unclassified Solwaraspora]|uniref:DUF3180 domain-containing protein n=1 Tax=unclassified Solwaraspora TaxID=2627926 RepID=UPI00259BDCBA|nr:DUF3180 domain-containing protein [Solwaraspora sp. WMMA2056]WJK41192.1 DUF3180 domain-containing protein [Solwaraspora sp. WMMA2056]
MEPTRASTLVVAALAAAAVGWWVISTWYVRMPVFPWLPSVTLAALAVLEAYAAVNTRARIDRRPGQDPVNPLLVARFVVLAKASALAGAIFAGFYAGLVLWLFIQQTRAADNDLPAAVSGLAASLALVAAAVWLERACRVPDQPEDSDAPQPPVG